MKFNVSFEFKGSGQLLSERGLDGCGLVQRTIDSDILRLTEPYVPFDTGMLKDSGITATDIGSGVIVYDTPYARRQYYENKGNGRRGKLWFERMKADHRDEILRHAAEVAGGKQNDNRFIKRFYTKKLPHNRRQKNKGELFKRKAGIIQY